MEPSSDSQEDLEEKYRLTREQVAKQINMEQLIHFNDIAEDDVLNALFDLIVDTLCTTQKTVRIAGQEKPAAVVRSVFSKIDAVTVRLAMQRIRSSATTIRNHRAYYLTALYDAQITKALEGLEGQKEQCGEQPEKTMATAKKNTLHGFNQRPNDGYELQKAMMRAQREQRAKKNTFHNFPQRPNTYDELEKELVRAQHERWQATKEENSAQTTAQAAGYSDSS